MPWRAVPALAATVAALLLPVLAEFLYDVRVRDQAVRRVDELRATHLRSDGPTIDFFRFGECRGRLSPSLWRDLRAGVSRRLGCSSELDAPGCEAHCRSHPTSPCHAYLGLQLEWGEFADRDVHTFHWSPSRLTFVPADDRSRCLLPGH